MKHRDLNLTLINVVGCAVIAVCGAAFVSLVTTNRAQRLDEIGSLNRSLDESQIQYRSLLVARDLQRDRIAKFQATLNQIGTLPDRAPMEAYVQTLSELAEAHDLRVISHQPYDVRRYPGLEVHPFSLELAGPFPGLVQFLRSVEVIDYWADISHIRIDAQLKGDAGQDGHRLAVLSFNVFSTLIEQDAPEDGA